MTLLPAVSKGKALITAEGLRCGAPRANDPDRRCNKQLAKRNAAGQIAGNFRCERCKQEIEIKLVQAQADR
jgi:hypothetical protein